MADTDASKELKSKKPKSEVSADGDAAQTSTSAKRANLAARGRSSSVKDVKASKIGEKTSKPLNDDSAIPARRGTKEGSSDAVDAELGSLKPSSSKGKVKDGDKSKTDSDDNSSKESTSSTKTKSAARSASSKDLKSGLVEKKPLKDKSDSSLKDKASSTKSSDSVKASSSSGEIKVSKDKDASKDKEKKPKKAKTDEASTKDSSGDDSKPVAAVAAAVIPPPIDTAVPAAVVPVPIISAPLPAPITPRSDDAPAAPEDAGVDSKPADDKSASTTISVKPNKKPKTGDSPSTPKQRRGSATMRNPGKSPSRRDSGDDLSTSLPISSEIEPSPAAPAGAAASEPVSTAAAIAQHPVLRRTMSRGPAGPAAAVPSIVTQTSTPPGSPRVSLSTPRTEPAQALPPPPTDPSAPPPPPPPAPGNRRVTKKELLEVNERKVLTRLNNPRIDEEFKKWDRRNSTYETVAQSERVQTDYISDMLFFPHDGPSNVSLFFSCPQFSLTFFGLLFALQMFTLRTPSH